MNSVKSLHEVLNTSYFQTQASVTHNSVCVESIFVDDSGPWKLSGFDYACRFDEATESHLHNIPSYVPPPEEKVSFVSYILHDTAFVILV